MENNSKILMLGLPNSCKTTFIGALWYLVSNREVDTSLAYESLPGERTYLNKLSFQWAQCEEVNRTPVGSNEIAEINLSKNEKKLTLLFPDLSGEIWSSVWENRACSSEIVSLVSDCEGILLFIHSDEYILPLPVVEQVAQSRLMGEKVDGKEENSYSPSNVPTQVKIVDILQLLAQNPFGSKKNRLTVMLSAWDLAQDVGKTPENYLRYTFPLLDQYLISRNDYCEFKVYGISALGGDIKTNSDSLLDCNKPSERIKVVDGTGISHDLTLPLEWLMEAVNG
jgi:hypothetical protein